MTGEERERKREKLDRLAKECYDLRQSNTGNDQAALEALEGKVFAGLLEYISRNDPRLEALAVFWEKQWKHFDPYRGGFCKFAMFQMDKLQKEQSIEENEMRQVKREDPRTGEMETVWEKRNLSLDAPAGAEDGGTTLGDFVADHGPRAMESKMSQDQVLVALALKVARGVAGGKETKKLLYFRLFFTDGVELWARERESEDLEAYSEDVFKAMELPFLDFFMAEECRDLARLSECPRKPYGALVPGKGPEEPPRAWGNQLHLPNDVYIAFFWDVRKEQITAQLLSTQRNAYRAFLREDLEIDFLAK